MPYFRSVLGSYPHPLPDVLDVGSGAGFVTVGLAEVARLTAIDRSHEAVRDARAAGIERVATADAGLLPFGDEVFDAVICSEVLEHVADPGAVIAEAARVTVPGGFFLFSTPVRSFVSRLVLVDAAQRWRATRVLPPDLHDWNRFLTRRELEDLLKANGFGLLRLSGIGVGVGRWPGTLTALALLKLGRIGYAEAGRRIKLTVTRSAHVAMIGHAERIR